MGQKLRYGRPCTRDLPGTHAQLACTVPHCFHFFTDYLMLAQSCKFGVICCSIGLTRTAACTLARVFLMG